MISSIDGLRRHALFYSVVLLWLHVPLVGGLAVILGTGGVAEAALLAVVAGVVTFERWRLASTLAVQMAAAAGLAIAVSTIVYVMRGHP